MNSLPNDKIEKYLDELSDEYKNLLYKALVARTKPLDDLSVSELLRIDSEIKKPLFLYYILLLHKFLVLEHQNIMLLRRNTLKY